jgi:hypothetical protein
MIAITGIIVLIHNLLLLLLTPVNTVLSHRVRRLTGKDGYGILYRFRLILLDFKFELHKNSV